MRKPMMRYVALIGLGLLAFAAGWTAQTEEASAAVCARGIYRAGCVGPRGAVGVHPYAGGFGSAACASGVAIELAAALVALARDQIESGAMRV
jgi:hypothetical protein